MTFLEAATSFIAALRLGKYSPGTVDSYADQLKRFGAWLEQQAIDDLRRLTRAHIDEYQRHVRAEPIGVESKSLRLRAVRRLFEHLAADGQLVFNPAEHVVTMRRRERLPRPVLTVKEVERLLAAPNTSLPLGIRDRALLEVLYATGIRVGELEQATVHHVDLALATLQVRHAKGGRPRVVPLGANATRWLKEYLTEVRPRLVRRRPFERTLFVVQGGRRPLAQTQLRALLQGYRKQAKLKKAVTPHLLRHTCATHLMAAGADIRAIQELLGHLRLDSTALYTRVAPTEVKHTHAQTHPRERAQEGLPEAAE
jgi:site-specific recombinase XerD